MKKKETGKTEACRTPSGGKAALLKSLAWAVWAFFAAAVPVVLWALFTGWFVPALMVTLSDVYGISQAEAVVSWPALLGLWFLPGLLGGALVAYGLVVLVRKFESAWRGVYGKMSEKIASPGAGGADACKKGR